MNPEQAFDMFMQLIQGMRPQSLKDPQAIIPADLKMYITRLESMLLGMMIGSTITVEQLKKLLEELKNSK